MKYPTGRLAALAALNEPLRRRIYSHLVGHATGVNRDEAAAAMGIPRSVAAFHLDKLADAGLLDVEYRRPPGRGGPGAGRPAKWYRRAAGEITFSVPERRYDLAADLLAGALEQAQEGSLPVSEALAAVAREHGQQIGTSIRPPGAQSPATTSSVVELLAEHGYEPRVAGAVISLANCPFHALAAEHRQIACGMNHALLCGVADQAGLSAGAARLDPAPDRCCVTITV